MNNQLKMIICGVAAILLIMPLYGTLGFLSPTEKAIYMIGDMLVLLMGFYAGRAWDEQE